MPDLREVFEMVKQQTEPDLDSWAEQERRLRRSARNKKIGAFALAAALAVGAAVFVMNDTNDTGDGDGGAVPADEPSTVAPATEPGFALYDLATGEMTSTGIVADSSAVDVSPDGTKIAYATSGTGLGATVHVANVDGSNVHEFARTDAVGDATAPRWSPDGTKLVYQGKPFDQEIGNVYVLDVVTGRVDRITDLEPTRAGFYYMAPTFSADGETVLFMKQNRDDGDDGLRWDLWSVPATGGEPTLFRRDASGADFSPNGDAMAFSEVFDAGFAMGDLYVARPDGSGARKVADGPAELPRWSPGGSQLAWSSGDGGAYVMDVETGETLQYPGAQGWIEWVDEDTFMIEVGVD